MKSAEDEIECQTAICQIGKVGEETARLVGFIVTVVPTKYDEDGCEGIEREESTYQAEE